MFGDNLSQTVDTIGKGNKLTNRVFGRNPERGSFQRVSFNRGLSGRGFRRRVGVENRVSCINFNARYSTFQNRGYIPLPVNPTSGPQHRNFDNANQSKNLNVMTNNHTKL